MSMVICNLKELLNVTRPKNMKHLKMSQKVNLGSFKLGEVR
jgi:hypothetical protein